MPEEKMYCIEEFVKDSSLAKEFLEEVEEKSVNFLDPTWRTMGEDEIIDKACYVFHIINHDLVQARAYTQQGKIN